MRIIIFLIATVLASGCATFPGKKSSKPASTTRPAVTRSPGEPPREVMKPEAVRYADISNPKRQVSQQLVAQGKDFLSRKDYDKARGRLEEAVSVDPTNGAAYYHLAVVYYDLKEYPKALGFLDQAETLLHTSPEWVETIRKFREMIR